MRRPREKWYDPTRYDPTRYDPTRYDPTWYDPARKGHPPRRERLMEDACI
ncbi:MAG: hypothetical protein OXU48_10130 [candidate division Zixibacteria bacterium]|nr:hypothetical protein [candidate division Zixibacteria bacterium]